MHDPGVGRHDFEARERLLCPAQQRVALPVALELEIGIHLERGLGAELIHDDRVIDDELGGEQRVDPRGIAAHLDDRVAHGGEIHHRGHPGEVL